MGSGPQGRFWPTGLIYATIELSHCVWRRQSVADATKSTKLRGPPAKPRIAQQRLRSKEPSGKKASGYEKITSADEQFKLVPRLAQQALLQFAALCAQLSLLEEGRNSGNLMQF